MKDPEKMTVPELRAYVKKLKAMIHILQKANLANKP